MQQVIDVHHRALLAEPVAIPPDSELTEDDLSSMLEAEARQRGRR